MPQTNVVTMPRLSSGRNTKTYYLIFSPNGDSPPAITESWKAAEYWKSRGCEVEPYTRFNTTKQ